MYVFMFISSHKREITVEFGKSHLLTKFAIYYLVLIDSRDWPYIVSIKI